MTPARGKTTIFDAITFALYGLPAARAGKADMPAPSIPKDTDPTFVELNFAYDNKKYTVRRNPEYTRAKARGGTTKQAADAQFTYPDGRIVTKVKDVDRAVQEVIGLTRDQFSQICMISPREFLEAAAGGYQGAPEYLSGYFLALVYMTPCKRTEGPGEPGQDPTGSRRRQHPAVCGRDRLP